MVSIMVGSTIAFVVEHSTGPRGSGAAEAIVISVPALAGRAVPASDLIGPAWSGDQGAMGAGCPAVLIADCEAGKKPCRTGEPARCLCTPGRHRPSRRRPRYS